MADDCCPFGNCPSFRGCHPFADWGRILTAFVLAAGHCLLQLDGNITHTLVTLYAILLQTPEHDAFQSRGSVTNVFAERDGIPHQDSRDGLSSALGGEGLSSGYHLVQRRAKAEHIC